MNQILVLADFTDTSKKALEQAITIAGYKGASIVICHIVSSNGQTEGTATQSIKEYAAIVEKAGIAVQTEIREGNLYDEVATYVKELLPSLVIVGTHGKKGLVQQLLGSKIYKLVTGLQAPVLVVSDFSDKVEDGFKKILIPVAPHDNFMIKVKAATSLMASDGKVVLFTIIKPGVELSDSIIANTKAAKSYFEEKGINWETAKLDMFNFSVGFSKDTMTYARNHRVDMIALMTEVADENRYYGKMDKENLMVNEDGIAILSVAE